jgi:hypothetical protein
VIRTKQGCSLSPRLHNVVLKVLTRVIGKKTLKKSVNLEMKKINPSVSIWHDSFYKNSRNPQLMNSAKMKSTLLNLIKQFKNRKIMQINM